MAAVPVSSTSAAQKIRGRVDKFVCLEFPPNISAIGEFYEDFSQVPDQVVIELLKASSKNKKLNYTF